ncbi:hypothetical protein [Thermococcus sp.]|uniref:DUF7344 domain-containing protein n=1 Tax=Thermococcus sp. TaxID=35749 RepID=UPI0026368CA6|nr:hypothetical protein [Thermococcus sp.]
MGTSSIILGNSRRMLMIEYLQNREGRAELRDVVDFIAEKEGATDRKHRKSVYVSLVQTHIPKLEREGVISFERGTVRLLKIPEDVTVYMEVVGRHDISWSTFYAGISLIFILTGMYLENVHLTFAALVYLLISLLHHRLIKRLV